MSTKKAIINGADENLATMLKNYKVDSYEKREKSNGSRKLYLRLSLIQPVTQLIVK